MSETSPRQFLELLKKSELVDAAVLKKSLADLGKQVEGKPVRLKALGDHLVSAGLITEWHRDCLCEGKYKGYFLGQYRLLGLIGAGGMSTVYLAEHKLSRHRRAIKILPKQRVADKSYLDRFYREGRAAAALNDPNIVRIYDLANEGDVHYMVMEYVEGIDLQDLVAREGPLDVDRALKYVRQAATGLKHAHDRKIVHRDVKPSNLLANSRDEIRVLDLGLALMHEGVESLTLLHNDRVMGTADYLSPEQAIDSHEVDHRADIYSLGCTLYFLLTGRPPFPDGSIAQRIAMHQTREAPLVSEINRAVPESVAQLCHIMMKKSREDRIQDCRELINEINSLQGQMDSSPDVSGQTDLALVGVLESVNGVALDQSTPRSVVANSRAAGLAKAGGSPVDAAKPAARSATNGAAAKRGVPSPDPSVAVSPASAPPASASPVSAPPAPVPPGNRHSAGGQRPARKGSTGSRPVAEKPPAVASRPNVSKISLANGTTATIETPPTGIAAVPRLASTRKKANRKTVIVVGSVILLMFGTLLAVLVIAIKMVQ